MTSHVHGSQPRDTNYKPISSLPPPSLSPPAHMMEQRGRGRQTPRFEGGPPPQCLTFIWINTFDQFHPPGKISLPSILPSPPLSTAPSSMLTFIKINTFDQFCPPGKISFCPLYPTHSSDCRKMAEYMVRHSSVSLSVITFSTQNILELYFGRWKVIFWLIIGALFIVTVAFHFKGHNLALTFYETGQ